MLEGMFRSRNVTIYVTDMDRSVRFYQDALGLKLAYRFGDHWASIAHESNRWNERQCHQEWRLPSILERHLCFFGGRQEPALSVSNGPISLRFADFSCPQILLDFEQLLLMEGQRRLPPPRSVGHQLDRNRERGMAVTVGRLRPCSLLDWKFVLLSHNTVRGAAGATILNAELLASLGKLEPVVESAARA